MSKIYQKHTRKFAMLLAFILCLAAAGIAQAQTTITYQGRLTDASMPATAVYDFQFRLYNPFGSPNGLPVIVEDVSVSNGVFTAPITFPASTFGTGAVSPRSLEIAVRPGASTGTFTVLAPRQTITNTPYADVSTKAATADNATALGGLSSSGFVQNTSTTQPGATNFNISGNGAIGGTLTTFNANVANELSVQGDVTAQGTFIGNGSGLSTLNASNITSGTLNSLRIPSLDAAKITTGTFADARLSSNVPLKNSINSFTGNQFFSAGVFAATVDASTGFNFAGNRILSAPGTNNFFAGVGTGAANTGSANTFVGRNAGGANTSGSSNTFVGYNAGTVSQSTQNTTGSNNTLLGAGTMFNGGTLTYATAVGAGTTVFGSNNVSIGRDVDTVDINGTFRVFKTASFSSNVDIGGQAFFSSSGLAINGDAACLNYNPFAGAYQMSRCSSSIRYKKDVENFTSGLTLVRRLRPVTFAWKSNDQRDLGFIAEEVNAVEPLMTTYNEKGEIQGVKYDRISAALVNAVNEQQTQIETQKSEFEMQKLEIQNQREIIERQQRQIDALTKFICVNNPIADVCREK